jgi:RNA polymerase sigma-70 factor (ECF subfamily)
MQMQLLGEDVDQSLLQAVAKGDSLALEELYRRHGSRVLAYLVGRLDDAGLAEEVLQDVMLSAWQNAGQFRGECRVFTWLLAIARNRAINAFHRRPAGSSSMDVEDPRFDRIGEKSHEIEKVGAYETLYAALQALPTEQRETLGLVFFQGLSMDETAYVLHVSTGTVKSRLHRAKARVRALMEADDLSEVISNE